MSRIQRINQFLQDYENLNPNLKSVLGWAPDHYQNELRQEFLKLAKHPLPSEHLNTV